jgi:hypothetical protein
MAPVRPDRKVLGTPSLGIKAVRTIMQSSRSRKNAWHERKQQEHSQVDRAGHGIATRDVLRNRTVLERGCQEQLGEHGQR